jgi:hypothetical protein
VGHESARSLDEVSQHVERLGLKADDIRAPPQGMLSNFERELAKPIHAAQGSGHG